MSHHAISFNTATKFVLNIALIGSASIGFSNECNSSARKDMNDFMVDSETASIAHGTYQLRHDSTCQTLDTAKTHGSFAKDLLAGHLNANPELQHGNTEQVQQILSYFNKQCEAYLLSQKQEPYIGQFHLQAEHSLAYEIPVTDEGLYASVIYPDFECAHYGNIWRATGGSEFFVIIDDAIYRGTGSAPYSVRLLDHLHIILPGLEAHCKTDDAMMVARAELCYGIATWDTELDMLTQTGAFLTLWSTP